MSDLIVRDGAVARDTDPITSYLAGENQTARALSEVAVLDELWMVRPAALSDAEIEKRIGGEWTSQRLRTARAQLVKKGLVVSAGRREHASPTGRAAMTWQWNAWEARA